MSLLRVDTLAGSAETIRTDGEGRFGFEALPHRRYRISAALDDTGGEATRRDVELSAATPELELGLTLVAARGAPDGGTGSQRAVVTPDDPANIELVVAATASISGRVVADGIELPSIFEIRA